MNLSSLGEFGLIARLHEKLAQRGGVILGIGDDAAVLDALSSPVITCDALIENIHFRRDWSAPRDLGWKSLAVNVSDIAAMGGTPVAAFVCLALPRDVEVEWVEELYAGLEDAAREYDLTIAGGDTTKSPDAVMISVTLIGNAPQPVLRSGAQVGDSLIVTGSIGDAAAGLFLLLNPTTPIEASVRETLMSRHHRPQARTSEMQAALGVTNAVHAALDLSDGLSGDAAHISRASGVTLEIDTGRLPLSPSCCALAASAGCDALEWALSGGEDYELLLCVAPEQAEAVCKAIESCGTAATLIGRVIERESAPVMLLKNQMREPASSGFAHF